MFATLTLLVIYLYITNYAVGKLRPIGQITIYY